MVCLAIALSQGSNMLAGGLLTNTNQHIAFNRMLSREASIAIDGVYYNPAGVAFLGEGHHLALNWQLAYQDRIIKNDYALFTNNVNAPITPREFKGKAFAPVIPSLQYAYNKGNWSFQANFNLIGGGGKCTFDNGLGSFERIVAETAMGACALAGAVDQVGHAAGLPAQVFSSDAMFGSKGSYSFNSYMHGRQYYYGLSIGAAYKFNDHFSAFAGLRTVYASCNYYGYVEDIKVGNMPLYKVLDPTKPDAANIELSCDQTGLGFTPIIGIDFKAGRWNFAAKYEFKTRMRLKNIGEYEDGKKIAGDIPSYLALGVGYKPVDALRINVGFHWFDDKNATSYNNRNKELDRGTFEYNAGVEYDLNKKFTVSTGWQKTSYGLSDEYMDDKSFVVSSNSVAVGGVYHINKKMDLNVAYFHTFYDHKKTSESVALNAQTSINYSSDYTRNNNVFGVGLDIHF